MPTMSQQGPGTDEELPTRRDLVCGKHVPVSNCDDFVHRQQNTISGKLSTLHRETLNITESAEDPDAASCTPDELYQAYVSLIQEQPSDTPAAAVHTHSSRLSKRSTWALVLVAGFLLLALGTQLLVVYLLGIRCLVPNNYLVWEATRPPTDCEYCRSIRRPLILPNMTREEFMPYAYSVQPIILKQAVAHWRAVDHLNFSFVQQLYRRDDRAASDDLLRATQDECQFLNFKSDFLTLERFLDMSPERAASGEPPWYVGFSNCQSDVLRDLRTLYPIPHFLPLDAEVPNTDYVFMGWARGAIMHLDYIPRLMWQAQLRGNKSWEVAPTPECAAECVPFGFYVEPGDAVLMDTRIWYHATTVLNGEFSLTIQSEYG